MPKPQRHCIFCGATGLTREHVWAKWLRPYLAMDMVEHTIASTIDHPTHALDTEKRFPGDPRRRRLRVVCLACNIGWMSRLQERAKPFVLPLLDGRTITLDAIAQSTIAAWATMTTMTAEFYDPQKVAIPFSEREHLRLHQQSPLHWRIWLANYTRYAWVPLWVHHLIPMSSPKDVPEIRDDGTARPNTQTTVFVFGQLYVYAVSSQTEIFDEWITENHDSRLLRQIWPIQAATINWPPARAMTDIEADRLATAFYDRVTADWRSR